MVSNRKRIFDCKRWRSCGDGRLARPSRAELGSHDGARFLISLALLTQGVPHPSRTLRRVGAGTFTQRTHPCRIGSIATRPCKERKDVAPTVGLSKGKPKPKDGPPGLKAGSSTIDAWLFRENRQPRIIEQFRPDASHISNGVRGTVEERPFRAAFGTLGPRPLGPVVVLYGG